MRLFIYPKDLITLEKVSRNTAYQRYKNLLFIFNKPLKSYITINEYATYNNTQVADLIKLL